MISSTYTEMRPADEPLRRHTYYMISWIANSVAILGGLYSIIQYSSIISMIITAFYCINIYVLLGDYSRWFRMRKVIIVALLCLLGVDTLVMLIEYYFVFKAGYYNERREGEQMALYMLWGSFLFEIAFLVASFITKYFLYPDQLSLLSMEHPATAAIEENIRKSDGRRNPKMFDLEADDEVQAVITKSDTPPAVPVETKKEAKVEPEVKKVIIEKPTMVPESKPLVENPIAQAEVKKVDPEVAKAAAVAAKPEPAVKKEAPVAVPAQDEKMAPVAVATVAAPAVVPEIKQA